ncbi:MAG: hypothetical protein INR73_17655 [Williamsia sp.]|nr:hypothetical protein [Williamsia sp.]
MKSNLQVNTSLFKAEPTGSNYLVSGMVVYHPLLEPGVYQGTITKDETAAGDFTIVCESASAETQANIDLYLIDTSLAANAGQQPFSFTIRPGGYAVLYSSFGEGKYTVALRSEKTDYSTAKLQKGDLLMLLLMKPGTYQVEGNNHQTCSVYTRELTNSPEDIEALNQTVNVVLGEQVFDPAEVNLIQGQGLVIHFDVNGEVNIDLIEAKAVQDSFVQEIRTKHAWENPKYKYKQS